MNQRALKIPEDVITEADTDFVISAHFREEQLTEKHLGDRYKAKMDGSQRIKVNTEKDEYDMVD